MSSNQKPSIFEGPRNEQFFEGQEIYQNYDVEIY
jgi:hypothetical protein